MKFCELNWLKKIGKSENVSPEDLVIKKIASYGEAKIKYVVVYYKANTSQQKSKTFIYDQAILGEIVVGKEVTRSPLF